MRSRRGNAQLTVMALTVLAGFGALAVDLGLLRTARVELQGGTDAGALAGASFLDGTWPGVRAAHGEARREAARHTVLGTPIDPTRVEVQLGRTDREGDRLFEVIGAEEARADPSRVNALRVVGTASGIAAVLAAPAFGIEELSAETASIAARHLTWGPASTVPCWLPIAVPDCHLTETPLGENPQPLRFTFGNPVPHRLGWADPSAEPDVNGLRSQLEAMCDNVPLAVGDTLAGSHALHIGALQRVAELVNRPESSPWPAHLGAHPARGAPFANDVAASDIQDAWWGRSLVGVVPLVDAGSCSAVDMDRKLTITGFAHAVLYDVGTAVAGRENLWAQVDFGADIQVWSDIDSTALGAGVHGYSQPLIVL